MSADQKQEHYVSWGIIDEPSDTTGSALFEKDHVLINLKTWLKNHCSYAFLETYGFDGFDIRKKTVATTRGYDEFWRAKTGEDIYPYTLSFGLILATFLGLPTRLAKVVKDRSNHEPNYILKLDWRQFFRGLIGGWDPIYLNGKAKWTTKKKLQVAALVPIKFPIIFLFKLLTFPIKLLINIAKLFTEFLPMIIIDIFGPLLYTTWSKTTSSFKDKSLGNARFIIGVAYLLLNILPLTPFLIGRALKFFGMTLTSPDKSARISYTYGRKVIKPLLALLDIDKHSRLGKALRFIVGAISGILSVLTTAGLWAIAFPIIIGAIFSYFPVLTQAFAWLGQFPMVTSAITTLENTLAVVGVGTAHAYGTFIAALSGYLHVQVTGMMLLVGTAFGALLAPVGSIMSRLDDVLSDWWATWGEKPLSVHLSTLIHSPSHKKPSTAPSVSNPSINAVSGPIFQWDFNNDDDLNRANALDVFATNVGDRAEGEGVIEPLLTKSTEGLDLSIPDQGRTQGPTHYGQ